MNRPFLTFLLGGVFGGIAGFAAGIFVFPHLFLNGATAGDPVVKEVSRSGQVIAVGHFPRLRVADSAYYGHGSVTVYRSQVHLESDFEVGPGPKYHIYLVPSTEVTSAEDVKDSMFVDLGPLQAFKGSQSYAIPYGLELTDHGSVVIWSEYFNAMVTSAALDFVQTGSQ